jgi:hypothetical protein
MAAISTKDELKDAIKRGDSTIEIEGDLANRIVKIKATGGVAWAIAFGAIGIAVFVAISALPAALATGGTSTIPESALGLMAGGAAAATLGFNTTAAAVALAVMSGGVGILTSIRSSYKIIESSDGHVLLQKS